MLREQNCRVRFTLAAAVVVCLLMPCGADRAHAQCDPRQVAKLLASDGAEGDQFGNSVSVNGDVALIGAYKDDDNGSDSGSAFVFGGEFPCPADLTGDGDVDTTDLLYLLANWGTPDGDVDGDGDTDTSDLLAQLAAWSDCPRWPCPWDFNGDGVVDDDDMAILFQHMGDCPDPPRRMPVGPERRRGGQ